MRFVTAHMLFSCYGGVRKMKGKTNLGATLGSSNAFGNSRGSTETAKTPGEKLADKVFWLLRTLTLANIIMLFFPAFNPARVCEEINRNLSLFTCGVSYDSLVVNVGRALKRGWLPEEAFKMLQMSSIIVIIGCIVIAVGGCMSLGNLKLKKLSNIASLCGAVIEGCALMGISGSANMLLNAENPDKAGEIALPAMYTVFLVMAIAIAVLSIVIFVILPKITKVMKCDMEGKYKLFLMFLPIVALTFVFSYLPLYGWRYAFFEYKSGETLSMDKFVGFKWFTQLFQNAATRKDVLRVIKNTLGMSALGIGTSWLPMVFAIFLAEVKNTTFRRLVQTFTTIPNFISWVLVYAIALAIFSTDGFINTLITAVSGTPTATNYLLSADNMWLKMLAWGTWKGLGWSAIIYIASITGIDQQLYEAATVDGAGRFQKMWYITVPELIPTYMVLLLMSVANILSNGMDQYLVFSNAVNKEQIEVLDLYVYNLGIGAGLIPMSTVIGMVKSVISVILLFSANGISKLVRGESIV